MIPEEVIDELVSDRSVGIYSWSIFQVPVPVSWTQQSLSILWAPVSDIIVVPNKSRVYNL